MRQKRMQILVAPFAIVQAGEEIDNPRPAPARVPAAVCQTVIQRLSRGGGELRRFRDTDLPARMKTKEVGNVPVARRMLLKLLGPFQDSSIAAYACRCQAAKRSLEFLAKISIDVQYFCGIDAVGE
ncbi:hypothetical protein ES703_119262 [subsurface metagenome]